MGGGTTDRFPTDELTTLAERARRTLEEADRPGRRNVFISFDHEDERDVNLLRGQARNEDSDLEFNDWSVKEPYDSENAEYIRRNIRERIRQSSATLVYLSDKTASSRWVDWEIRESIALGKKVVCVYQGQKPASVPTAVTELGLKCVPWQHDLLMRELKD